MSEQQSGSESVFDRLRRETREQQQREFEAVRRQRDLTRVFRGGKHVELLLARFGLLTPDTEEDNNA